MLTIKEISFNNFYLITLVISFFQKHVKWTCKTQLGPFLWIYPTCAGSLDFPGVGLRGFGVDGASPVLEEPGISFLRLGARSNPFPWGEWGGLPAGEFGSWMTKRIKHVSSESCCLLICFQPHRGKRDGMFVTNRPLNLILGYFSKNSWIIYNYSFACGFLKNIYNFFYKPPFCHFIIRHSWLC